jgi:PAS domain S-box-containing protein
LLRARIRGVEDVYARRLRSIFESVPVAIALLRGPEHTFELANPSYANLVGRDVVGKSVQDAFPEVEPHLLAELFDRVFQSGQPFVARSRRMLARRPGEPVETQRFIDLALHPLADDSGAVDGLALVAYDVTEMAVARRQAEVANRAKDEFLAMLGHELRNPLAPILTALQLLRLRGVDAGRKEREVIERQVNHLVRLVDDLLDVSRITRGKVQLNRARVHLADIVAKAIETASPLLEQYGHHLVVDVPRGDLTVDVDVERVAQVIANLLTNAAKYTNPGGTITVTGSRAGDAIELSVTDTGIGIEPEMLPKVFDLFAQEPQALDRARGGLGLGLAIVRSLVTLHGGSVSASSAGRNRGATFTVSLPAASGAPAAIATDARRAPVVQAGNGRRVLIVDDNEDAARMLAAALESFGYEVEWATDGPGGLAAARQFKPEIGLLDIGLPVMDGYELARRFAADQELARTRLIAITGYGQERDRERSRQAGFVAHLIKPLDVQVLRSVMEEA